MTGLVPRAAAAGCARGSSAGETSVT